MRVCHNLWASFDDPNLVSCAGLVSVMALAERAGLHCPAEELNERPHAVLGYLTPREAFERLLTADAATTP